MNWLFGDFTINKADYVQYLQSFFFNQISPQRVTEDEKTERKQKVKDKKKRKIGYIRDFTHYSNQTWEHNYDMIWLFSRLIQI